jgi:type 1 glutamine amidotransferase
MPRLVFHVGGPAFHPVAAQAAEVATWLDDGLECDIVEGRAAFDALDGCDLLVLMGLHWTGMTAAWAGDLPYLPLLDRHKHAFEDYITAGRPLLVHHGAIASYDDWPRFGELVGYWWVWGASQHSPFGTHQVRVQPTEHPITSGVADYTIDDELFYNLHVAPGYAPSVLATASWDGREHPMVMTHTRGEIGGAGRTVYLANGHDLRAFEAPALRTLWLNAIHWLLEGA